MGKYDGQACLAIVFSHIFFYTVGGLRNPTACQQMQYSVSRGGTQTLKRALFMLRAPSLKSASPSLPDKGSGRDGGESPVGPSPYTTP